MFPVTTTIDSSSPLIDYQPDTQVWRRGGWEGDKFAPRYQNSTFMYCINATDATATFNFTGNEVHIFGAYRYNSGPYSVTIDGTKSEYMRANGSAPAENDDNQFFQVELYGVSDLRPGTHQVVFTNEWGNSPTRVPGLDHIDIDYITFTSSAYSNETAVIQSEHAEYFSFTPQDAWVNVLGDEFNGGAEHAAVDMGASVSLTFQGDRVALYGAYGQSYAVYTAQLDDGPVYTMNGSRTDEPIFQQLLFKADLLEADIQHNLTLMSASEDGTKFAVDYAEVDETSNNVAAVMSFSSISTSTLGVSSTSTVADDGYESSFSIATSVPPSSATTTDDVATSSANPSQELSQGAAGGIAAGSVLGAAALIAVAFLFWRQTRKREDPPAGGHPSPAEYSSPLVTPYVLPTGYGPLDGHALASPSALPPPSAGPTISSLSSRFLPGSSVSYPHSAMYTSNISHSIHEEEPQPPRYTA